MSEKMYPIPFKSLMNWVVDRIRRLRRDLRRPQGLSRHRQEPAHLR